MPYHVAHGVQSTPGSPLKLGDIRGKVADHVLRAGLFRVPLLAVAALLGYGEHLIQNLGDLLILDGLVRQLVSVHGQLVHVLVCHIQAHPRLMELGLDVASMSHRPRTSGPAQGDVQGVVANHTNRGHADANSTASVVGVGETQVRLCLVPDDLRIR